MGVRTSPRPRRSAAPAVTTSTVPTAGSTTGAGAGPTRPTPGTSPITAAPAAASVTVLLVVCALLIPAALYVGVPLAGPTGRRFGVGAAAASWTSGAFALAYAAGFLAAGPVAARLGPRRTLAGASGVLAVVTAVAPLAGGYGAFLTVRAGQGLAAAMFAPVALVYTAERTGPARRGAALAWLTTGLLGAGLVGQLLGTGLLAWSGWEAVFWVSAAGYGALAVALWLVLAVDGPPVASAGEGLVRSVAELLRDGRIWPVFVAAFGVFGTFVAMYRMVDTRLVDDHQAGTGLLLAFEAVGCVGLLAAPVVARTGLGRSPRAQSVAGFLLAAAGLGVLQIGGVAVMVAGSVAYVAGTSLVVPGLVGLLATGAGERRAVAVGVNTCVLFVGAAVVPALVVGLGYRPGLLALTVLPLAGAALLSRTSSSGSRQDSQQR
ncbi:arabinose efflux permease family protein [Frankia sp. EI5c]|uniref:MFS transporter n=1 Tax=Frankia sp. EI5c TaxID=683316 RepID=UPI0007C248C7|nr:MFS transporter [Frankia sp. EI5c]OAA29037.1 arabinose efflux permease family protein [Frankia sp. EI5c]